MKKFYLVLAMFAFFLSSIFTSCWSTGTARETIPKTAVTLQRARSTILQDQLVQIFVNDVPYELANGESISILVNNGDYMVYAVAETGLAESDALIVIGPTKVESDSIRFTAKSQTITITVTPITRFLVFPALTIAIK